MERMEFWEQAFLTSLNAGIIRNGFNDQKTIDSAAKAATFALAAWDDAHEPRQPARQA